MSINEHAEQLLRVLTLAQKKANLQAISGNVSSHWGRSFGIANLLKKSHYNK